MKNIKYRAGFRFRNRGYKRWVWLSLLLLFLLFPVVQAAADGRGDPISMIVDLRCEFMKTPLGIDDTNPALSWTIQDERRGVVQTAYRVLVATSEELLAQGNGDLWDSGLVKSDQSHLVVYKGKPLISRMRCHWKVQVQSAAADGSGVESTWSPPSWWEMGLLQPDDWAGSWIQSTVCHSVDNEITRSWIRHALIPQELNHPVIMKDPGLAPAARAEGERLMGSILPAAVFRTGFNVPGTVRRARVYISGLGFHELFVNGTAVSDRMHDPSITYYAVRGGYVTHDVTHLVRNGANVFTVVVGAGWWHESVVWGTPGNVQGLPSLMAQIEIELEGGKRMVIPTSADWKTTVGPILKNHYYAGEVYDARRAAGWNSGEVEGAEWSAVKAVGAPVPRLEAQRCEPERVLERIKPVAVSQPRPGIWVFDLGRIVMGTVELNINAPVGTTVMMRTAEWTWQPVKQGPGFNTSLLHYDQGDNRVRTEGMIVGKPRGSTYFSWGFGKDFKIEGLETVSAVHLGVPTLVYVARGDAAGETWRPSFTIHPFRYVEVQGLETAPTADLITGLIISNDFEMVGNFVSGNPLFNDIFEASMNSTTFNTHGMAWDNAVERLQSQVYNAWSAPFASHILWYPNLWRKIMEDQRLCNVLFSPAKPSFGTAIYGSRSRAPAAIYPVQQGTTVELPIQYYLRYGDIRELEKHYPHMKVFCEAFFPNRDGIISEKAIMAAWNDHFYKEMADDSDWTPEWDQRAMMSMMLYEYTRQTAAVAALLGKKDEASSLDHLAGKIRNHVNATWYDRENKTYGAAISKKTGQIDASTGWHGLMAMAIAKGIAPQEDIPELFENCVADMKIHYNSHAATGHITHQLLYDVFSDHGLIESCYDMMNAAGFPSFAWMLQSGNRTIPEGPTWQDALPAKASAYQNECQEPARWFTQTLCGVSPNMARPGYKHVFLRPRIPLRLPSASLVTRTSYGTLESSWKQANGTVTWKVRIPANTQATVWIPVRSASVVQESGKSLTVAAGCRVIGSGIGGLECQLGSGVYSFRFPAPKNEPSRLGELK